MGDMIKPQELSTPISDVLREWQGKEIVESLGDLIWNDMNEEWAEYMNGPSITAQLCDNRLGKEERRDEKVVDRVTFCCGTGESLSK